MRSLIFVLAIVVAVSCNDLEVGSSYGRILFFKKVHGSPTFWVRKELVTVSATEHEVISRIVVTDERPNKDGRAKIIEGGKGLQNVTIELKSPAFFRGFDFDVVVYAIDKISHPNMISKDVEDSAKDGVKEVSTTERLDYNEKSRPLNVAN